MAPHLPIRLAGELTTNMRLSPKYTDKDWQNIDFTKDEGRQKAIDIAEDCIRGRWLVWADRITDERYSGFVVLALDCIVLESLWGFRNGKPVPKRHEQEVYREMLTAPVFGLISTQSEEFRTFVRNGVMHDAETRGRWRIEMTIPRNAIVYKNSQGDHIVNRSRFHKAVTGAVKQWLDALRGGDRSLRENMRKRMDEIINTQVKI